LITRYKSSYRYIISISMGVLSHIAYSPDCNLLDYYYTYFDRCSTLLTSISKKKKSNVQMKIHMENWMNIIV